MELIFSKEHGKYVIVVYSVMRTTGWTFILGGRVVKCSVCGVILFRGVRRSRCHLCGDSEPLDAGAVCAHCRIASHCTIDVDHKIEVVEGS